MVVQINQQDGNDNICMQHASFMKKCSDSGHYIYSYNVKMHGYMLHTVSFQSYLLTFFVYSSYQLYLYFFNFNFCSILAFRTSAIMNIQ